MIPTYRPYVGKEELEAVRRVLESRWLGMGRVVEQFEGRLAELVGAKHVVAVSSGTAALHLALLGLGLRAGDEVIVPSFTFAASPQAIVAAGAVPVFADICERTLTIDADDVRRRMTDRTKAVMPVHFGGTVCAMDELCELARRRNVKIVDDAAHAFGSRYNGRMVGTLGDVTCFSFDPIKNITCAGGGAIATDDPQVAERTRLLRYLGIRRDDGPLPSEGGEYEVVDVGYRYHMSDLNAAIGLAQLDRLDTLRRKKQTLVRRYNGALREINGVTIIERDVEDVFPFGYFVLVPADTRADLRAYLRGRGVETRVQFAPNHRQPAFSRDDLVLPVTQRVAGQIVTLPLYHEMTDADVDAVVDGIRSFFAAPCRGRRRLVTLDAKKKGLNARQQQARKSS